MDQRKPSPEQAAEFRERGARLFFGEQRPDCSRADAARQDVFADIEMFHNPKRKHTNNGMLPPVDFEIGQLTHNEAGL